MTSKYDENSRSIQCNGCHTKCREVHLRDRLESLTSLEKGNYLQRGEGGPEANSRFFHFQWMVSFLLEGHGGLRKMVTSFLFLATLNFLKSTSVRCSSIVLLDIWLMWQSPIGKQAVPHWASMLRWIKSISEYNLNPILWILIVGTTHHKPLPKNMCHTHGWPQQLRVHTVNTMA